MERATLVLNADYSPMKVVSWQRAVHLWFSDKVEVVEEYDDFDLNSMAVTIKCPSVVRLLKYIKRDNKRVKFSRVNVFGRDFFTCQYCQEQPGTPALTYDHVLPRAQGGQTTWDNIVTACIPCNSRKGNRTPEKADMPLMVQPVRPAKRPYSKFKVNLPKTPEAWRSYLWWTQELETDSNE